MWTLVMTICLGEPKIHNSEVVLDVIQVNYFESEQACRYAGAQQEVALRNDLGINTAKHYTFVCVNIKEQ